MIANAGDRHVFARQTPLRTELAAYIGDCSSYAEIARAIELLLPAATQIDPLDWTGPQRIMRELIGLEIVAAVACEFQVDEHIAIGKIVRHLEELCPDALTPLRAVPPDTIHAMQRGPDWIGDVCSAGIAAAALELVGADISDGALLDYGCSSGSAARVLATCYPRLRVTGCDPVASSISWARDNLQLPNLAFVGQKQQPPLSFDDESFDTAIAISVFSHHGPAAARRWFAEIARVLKPGGHLVFTTHGPGSLLLHADREELPLGQLQALTLELSSVGHAFWEPWIGEDDCGNIATPMEWGCSYYLPSAVVALMHPALEPLRFASRANQRNQDVYVARKAKRTSTHYTARSMPSPRPALSPCPRE